MLPYDPDLAIKALCTTDPDLANLIQRVGPYKLTLSSEWTPFQALIHAVLFQQISRKAGQSIQNRLWNLFGHVPTPSDIAQTNDESLRGVGLSRNKLATCRGLAQSVLEGTLPDRNTLDKMSDEAVTQILTAHRGIGPWTAHMLLIFHLGRPDVLPASDLGVRKGFRIAFNLETLPTITTLIDHGDRWKPWRSVASWYLWRANDL